MKYLRHCFDNLTQLKFKNSMLAQENRAKTKAVQTEDIAIRCPFCFEEIFIGVDPSGGDSQQYVEDCQVCCKPIEIEIERDSEGQWTVEAEKGD